MCLMHGRALYRAQQDLIKAKYDYIQAWALLHQYTNTLDIEKIKIIEKLFSVAENIYLI